MNRYGPEGIGGAAARARRGEMPLVERVELALARIEAFEPEVLSLLPEPGKAERLRAEAAALERRWPDPATRPPLFGTLLGVKDIFSADGFETRAGSRLPPELFAMRESSVVSALKRSGALVLGKTVSTEFAYFAPGPTRNPVDTGRTPGGSSSGSAAAVAAAFCELAFGTQTIGSISRPAAFCGVSGWKPTWGRVAADGLVPFAPSLDHVGLIGADAATLAAGAELIDTGWDAAACARAARRFEATPPVLLVPDGPYLAQADAAALESFERSLARLEGAGFRVVRTRALGDIVDVNARHRRIAAAEMAATHAPWFDGHRALYHARTVDLIEQGRAIGVDELAADRAGQGKLRGELDAALALAGADFWVSPSAPGPAPRGIESTGDPVMNLPWTHAGVPTLALPSGEKLEGLPLGLQFAGRSGADEELLAAAEVLESALAR
ncbi:MAG TPA: amidase [Spirochaetales bacterium]|nr:amidase [Spirochaetales bacterium]